MSRKYRAIAVLADIIALVATGRPCGPPERLTADASLHKNIPYQEIRAKLADKQQTPAPPPPKNDNGKRRRTQRDLINALKSDGNVSTKSGRRAGFAIVSKLGHFRPGRAAPQANVNSKLAAIQNSGSASQVTNIVCTICPV